MEDKINECIRIIQKEDSLSAECRNMLHGATTGHPWCAGKSVDQRVTEIVCAVAGRRLSSDGLRALYRIERMARHDHGGEK